MTFLLGQLTPERRAEMSGMVEARHIWTDAEIGRALDACMAELGFHGAAYSTAQQTVNRHRNAVCQCARQTVGR